MISTIGVVGAGTMGSGIANLAALSGFNVILVDLEERVLQKALSRMESFMDKSIAKGKITPEQKHEAMEKVRGSTDLREMKHADVIIEAVIENIDVKKEVFSKLDQIAPEHAILATNTSSMSITEIASATNRPNQVVGMHFFNPPQLMKLVEVVRGYKTSDETVEQAKELARKLKKEPVEVKKDSPGFIVNRIMIPQFIEAIRLVEEGVASMEDIDKAVTLGLNYPMGPFTLQDFAGVDIGLHVMDYFYQEFKDDRFAAPLLLRQLVRAGRLGRKTGAGFYDYDDAR
ncbi:3-hydroxyacyl-CoA dehydrogenase family protein [Parageobacillus toebii NBRC 107807]|uniref:3-hydroxybutyryl-CoA dehydrogenase n=1 Tax=Parageobacillus toebii NBRC 107807 TaxID=1223503 RepID=A0A6G9J6E0_9BACL|nr:MULTISPECIES: 3-hydroxyacyl-CoA dehydrogenase family protein [Bacillaceae]RDV21215.1 3-hydroxyacyl-CoA dehydrogenase family protein [Parageobacillus toebii]MBB3869520.1 3-hydroxybutyryl-CoA dehydrogenase [Parageobacillus toebii NBRC 107807]PUF86860.1 3-hydroxyacyl-CoA dehydrogenase family protein [Geobacillus sp. LYN3]QIQ33797.1 3-hydroxyacyl-CoA dehydrogenase family protein [Parageobacillus toebii NBRC 107807]TXK87700.1 3-hydroxyacyl-CoA dehydrogenase family protein [Geobacillus sp. AYS3]